MQMIFFDFIVIPYPLENKCCTYFQFFISAAPNIILLQQNLKMTKSAGDASMNKTENKCITFQAKRAYTIKIKINRK